MTDSLVARARVIAVHADGRLSLRLSGAQACPGCRCGRLTLAEPAVFDLELAQPVWISAGTEVLVSTPATDVLRGAAWLHGLPWISMVLGAAFGAAAGFGDLGSLLGGVVGVGAALLALRGTRHRWRALPGTALRVESSG
jgi:positive regulator of sigma E activity